MSIFKGVFLAVGGLSFPAGWDSPKVRGICGAEVRACLIPLSQPKCQADDFVLGSCGFRWAALLALVAFVDSIVLGELDLLLSFFRH